MIKKRKDAKAQRREAFSEEFGCSLQIMFFGLPGEDGESLALILCALAPWRPCVFLRCLQYEKHVFGKLSWLDFHRPI